MNRCKSWTLAMACVCAWSVSGLTAAASNAASTSSAGGTESTVDYSSDSARLVGEVRKRLQSAAVVRGQFEQKKSVRGFKHPLISTGDFIVAQDAGVLWHTKAPFESRVTVTRERILTTQVDGQVTSRMDAKDEPGLRAVNEMLFAVMAADLSVLAQRFVISGGVNGSEGWKLTLTPKDKALTQWLSRIELEGDRFVRTVRMHEAQGDVSVIRFTGQSAAKTLAPEDVKRFE